MGSRKGPEKLKGEKVNPLLRLLLHSIEALSLEQFKTWTTIGAMGSIFRAYNWFLNSEGYKKYSREFEPTIKGLTIGELDLMRYEVSREAVAYTGRWAIANPDVNKWKVAIFNKHVEYLSKLVVLQFALRKVGGQLTHLVPGACGRIHEVKSLPQYQRNIDKCIEIRDYISNGKNAPKYMLSWRSDFWAPAFALADSGFKTQALYLANTSEIIAKTLTPLIRAKKPFTSHPLYKIMKGITHPSDPNRYYPYHYWARKLQSIAICKAVIYKGFGNLNMAVKCFKQNVRQDCAFGDEVGKEIFKVGWIPGRTRVLESATETYVCYRELEDEENREKYKNLTLRIYQSIANQMNGFKIRRQSMADQTTEPLARAYLMVRELIGNPDDIL